MSVHAWWRQGPRPDVDKPGPVRIDTIFVKCGCRAEKLRSLRRGGGQQRDRAVQRSAVHCIASQPLRCVCSHSSHCVHVIDQSSSPRPSSTSHHGLLRPHSSTRDGVWLDPCGLTVSCQTCTLAGSTGPQGPVLPGACAKEKKREREKREAVSGPAGPAGCPSRTRPRAEGGPGVALGGQGRQKTLHPPGSLHSSPNQKLHLSICSNLNGPDRAPCSPSCPPVARCQRPSGGVTPQGAPGARRAGAILASSLPVSEGL